jgi:SMI1 / KNR4 family (SUKH-1)
MIRYVLQFCLTSPEDLSEKESEKWGKKWDAKLKPLTIWMTSLGDCQVDLTVHGQELLEFLQKVRKEGGRIVVPLDLHEKVVDDEQSSVEWFIIDPEYMGDFNESINDAFESWISDYRKLLNVKADKIKPGVNVSGWTPETYVSERFKEVVEKYRLTGIEFFWMKDMGKYRATQWYLPICHKFLGRGLDHPWIDIAKVIKKGWMLLDPRGRSGMDVADGELLRRGAATEEPLLKQLFPLIRSMERLKRAPTCWFRGRYLRKYLPDTDFAYTIEDSHERSLWISRRRGLAMNRKARDLLKANRLVSDNECKHLLIMDRAPKGVENLDKRYGPAEPLFSSEQLTLLRELEAKAWAQHVAYPKPPRAPDLKRSLSLLRARKRQSPKDFAKPANAKSIEETGKTLSRKIPAAWQQVLRITNGGRIDKSPLAAGHACIIMPLKDLPEWQKTESEYYRGIGAELPDSMLFIIHTEIGDSIWLDTAKQKSDGDCRVVLMSHETGEEERDWPTVAEFLEELLTETQDEEG